MYSHLVTILHTCACGSPQDKVFITPFSQSDIILWCRLSLNLTRELVLVHIWLKVLVSLSESKAYTCRIVRFSEPMMYEGLQIGSKGSICTDVCRLSPDPSAVIQHKDHHHTLILDKVAELHSGATSKSNSILVMQIFLNLLCWLRESWTSLYWSPWQGSSTFFYY